MFQKDTTFFEHKFIWSDKLPAEKPLELGLEVRVQVESKPKFILKYIYSQVCQIIRNLRRGKRSHSRKNLLV